MSISSTTTACPRCGEPVSTDDRYCEGCGHELQPARSSGASTGDGRVAVDRGVAAGVTHRGSVHRRNEDAMFLDATAGRVVAIVCDGVSSSRNPDIASRVAVGAAGDSLVVSSTDDRGVADDERGMHHAISVAQSAVARVPVRSAGVDNAPACTVAAATWNGSRVVVGNVGDSRVYWLDGDASRVLTEDDSWLQSALDAGVEPSVAARHPNAHGITRWLGAHAPDEDYRVVSFVPPGPGRLVVCSDGLWNYVPAPDDLARLVDALGAEASPGSVAHALVDHALDAGGHDNVTVIVVDVDPNRGPLLSPDSEE